MRKKQLLPASKVIDLMRFKWRDWAVVEIHKARAKSIVAKTKR